MVRCLQIAFLNRLAVVAFPEAAVDDQVASALHRIGVPTRKEITTLTRRVEKLTEVVRGKSAVKRKTTTKKTAKTASKKSARSSKKTAR